jgi:hypothetical protein
MRRNLLLVLALVVVPTVVLAGVDRAGGKMYFFKPYGQQLVLMYQNLRDGEQLSVQSNYGDPAREMIYHTSRGELVVGGAANEPEKCVVLENNAQGTNRVILWSCSGNAQWNEKWQLVPSTGQIKHVNHGGCLENSSGKTIIAPCKQSNSQRWFWQPARGTSYGR